MLLKDNSKLLIGLTLAVLFMLAGCGGTDSNVSWKEPSLKQFKQATEWGADYEEDATPLWIVCEEGFVRATGANGSESRASPCSGSAAVLVWTPLSVAAQVAQVRTLAFEAWEEEEETMRFLEDMRGQGVIPTVFIPAFTAHAEGETELKDLLTNELTLVLLFEGSIWDADSSYEATITQEDLVIRPFQSSPKYRADVRKIQLESRFKIKDLDPDKAFHFSVSQQGESGKRFTFKIDPEELGTKEFF